MRSQIRRSGARTLAPLIEMRGHWSVCAQLRGWTGDDDDDAASLLGDRCTLPVDVDCLPERPIQPNLLPKSSFRACMFGHDYCSAIRETDVFLGAIRLGKIRLYISLCYAISPAVVKPVLVR